MFDRILRLFSSVKNLQYLSLLISKECHRRTGKELLVFLVFPPSFYVRKKKIQQLKCVLLLTLFHSFSCRIFLTVASTIYFYNLELILHRVFVLSFILYFALMMIRLKNVSTMQVCYGKKGTVQQEQYKNCFSETTILINVTIILPYILFKNSCQERDEYSFTVIFLSTFFFRLFTLGSNPP